MDSLDKCFDQEHFQNYPYPIEYVYNSRGFRDAEWPASHLELQQAVWCIGDSFTVGIGQPLGHTWPNVLAGRIQKRIINVSMDGASNDWIYRRVLDIANTINPQLIIIMWSYVHRREDSDILLDDEQRRRHASTDTFDQDIQKWVTQVKNLKHIACQTVQLSIPEFMFLPTNIWSKIADPLWPPSPQTKHDFKNLPDRIKKELKELHNVFDLMTDFYDIQHLLPKDIIYVNERLDWARDHHHFDILTSRWVVDQIETRLRM